MNEQNDSCCKKCNGTRWYTPANQYGTEHSYRCYECCTHNEGWWQICEMYDDKAGLWCCNEGCGTLRDAAPEPENSDTSSECVDESS